MGARRVLIFAKRNMLEILRDTVSLVFLFVLPIGMLIMFYYLFHTQTTQFLMVNLAPGLISFSHVFLCLFTSLLLAGDRESAFITRLYTTPLKSYEFILGYELSVVPIGLIQTVLILLIAGCMDVSFFSWSLLICIPLSLVSILFFVSFGILFGSLVGQKAVGGLSSVLITAQSLLSGMWFPLETMSDTFNTVIRCLPFRSGSLLFQNVCQQVNGDVFFDYIHPLIVLLVYALFALVLSIVVYKKKMKQ